MRWVMLSCVLAVGVSAMVAAQEVRLLDCGTVAFFAPACVPQPPAPPTPPSPPEPLFTPETMAPDTPPLLLKLMEEPTTANAQKFLAWQQQRFARIQEVQRLLRHVHPQIEVSDAD